MMSILADSSGQPYSGGSMTSNSGFNGLISDGQEYTLGIEFPDSKYYDLFTSSSKETACNGEICYGHSLSEVHNWYNNWYGSNDSFVKTSLPWLDRGGAHLNEERASIFLYSSQSGYAHSEVSIHAVIS